MKGPPKYGFCGPPKHWDPNSYPLQRKQTIILRFNQVLALFISTLRYLWWYVKQMWHHRKPYVDGLRPVQCSRMQAAPIGGMGGGSIGRSVTGGFCRFQMIPGIYEYHSVFGDNFILTVRNKQGKVLQTTLAPRERGNSSKVLSSWKYTLENKDLSHVSLYPCAWYVYDLSEVKLKLTCKQISPIIPHDYKDSCLPVGVFVWEVENMGMKAQEEVEVSLTMTWKSGTGDAREDGVPGQSVETQSTQDHSRILLLRHSKESQPLTYGIGTRTDVDSGVKVTWLKHFDPKGSGKDLWDLLLSGKGLGKEEGGMKGKEMGMALCLSFSLAPSSSKQVAFALAWDMPIIRFRRGTQVFERRYTRWFGADDTTCGKLLDYALSNWESWEGAIEKWQEPVLSNQDLPDWYKSAIFNELYFVADGGTQWLEMPDSFKSLSTHDPRKEYGRFAWLESHEYIMINTYDVYFYASIALIHLWPKIHLSIQYDYAEATPQEDLSPVYFIFTGETGPRKIAYAVPHDLGNPDSNPYLELNAYQSHNTGEWKDLNLKFILQVYRDFRVFGDLEYLKDMWPVVSKVLERSFKFDHDGDGLIENGGFPDQTYDVWTMTGPSAYCGGLWVAALHGMMKMAEALGNEKEQKTLKRARDRASSALVDHLWNGSYFNFDCSGKAEEKAVMADQLCGHWALLLAGDKEEVFEKEHVKQALNAIYCNNVVNYYGGKQGAVNGYIPASGIDLTCPQSEEVWTGITYALASLMIMEGNKEDGWKTAKGLYQTVWEDSGLGFSTPEALQELSVYRSVGYMRPLAIWAIQTALETTCKMQSID